MIEKNIVDRVPTHAGRIRLFPVPNSPNVFDMERADEPTVVGTPIDKATLDSIIQSRLTGRYYQVAPYYTIKNTTHGTTTPLPTSGWTLNGVATATNSIYKVVASSSIGSDYSVEKAVDGKDDTSWGSEYGTTHTYTIIFPIAINIKKIGLLLGRSGDTTGIGWTIQGSNNGTTWADLFSSSTYSINMTTYTLTHTGDYSQYKITFNVPLAPRIYITSLTIPEWAANSYVIDYIAEKMPTVWDVGQRVTVQVPTYAAFVVDSNTFNGVKVNTILLSGRRYELRYNGTSFDAKEV
jgi:hypothetical protein